jgi:hypothetical protein
LIDFYRKINKEQKRQKKPFNIVRGDLNQFNYFLIGPSILWNGAKYWSFSKSRGKMYGASLILTLIQIRPNIKRKRKRKKEKIHNILFCGGEERKKGVYCYSVYWHCALREGGEGLPVVCECCVQNAGDGGQTSQKSSGETNVWTKNSLLIKSRSAKMNAPGSITSVTS